MRENSRQSIEKERGGRGSERGRKRESMNASGKAHTLAILSLGSLTAAIIAVGNLLLFSNWLTWPIKISHPRYANNSLDNYVS